MRISDWSSDVCSSDLRIGEHHLRALVPKQGPIGLRISCITADEPMRSDRPDIAQPRHSLILWLRHFIERVTGFGLEIGRAHVCTPVTNAHLVCRLRLEKQESTKRTVNHTNRR